MLLSAAATHDDIIMLQQAKTDARLEALLQGKTANEFSVEPLNVNEVSLLLWAAESTSAEDRKMLTTQQARHPLECYLLAAKVSGLARGIYRYHPKNHALSLVEGGDPCCDLCEAIAGQPPLQQAPVVIALAADFALTGNRERWRRHACMEAGHAARNVSFVASTLGLGTVGMSIFDAEEVKNVLQIGGEPLILLAAGRLQSH